MQKRQIKMADNRFHHTTIKVLLYTEVTNRDRLDSEVITVPDPAT